MAELLREPRAIVYQVRNRVNGKRYIGVTKRGLHARRLSHYTDARRGAGNLLHSAMRKYGPYNFDFEVMYDFDGDYDLAKLYEIEAIAKYQPEYNLSFGGEGHDRVHESTRAKIAAAHRGQKRSAEARANMSEGQRRRGREAPPSAETREKMRVARLGKHHRPESIAKMRGRKDSAETRAKKSRAQIGRPPTKGRTGQPVLPETREKIRQTLKRVEWIDTPARVASRARTGTTAAREARKAPVTCLDDGRVFESMRAAAEFYGFKPTKLSLALRKGWRVQGKSFARLPDTKR